MGFVKDEITAAFKTADGSMPGAKSRQSISLIWRHRVKGSVKDLSTGKLVP